MQIRLETFQVVCFTTRFSVMLNDGIVAWYSQQQPRVALSTMEVECMALTEATNEIKGITGMLIIIGIESL